MRFRLKHLASGFIAAITLICIGVYVAAFHSTMQQPPDFLAACVKYSQKEYFANMWHWTCKQVLFHATWNPEHVRELNQDAGVRYAFRLQESKNSQETEESEELLKLFIARGVNINAPNIRARDFTALHEAVLFSDFTATKLLLQYGARTDLRDTNGQTPLDWARRMQLKKLNEPKAAEVVRLLESHYQKSANR
jgi:hypothetical protein